MALKTVKEDLQASTLRAIAGLLGKLEYFAGLREADGTYSHWGLSRVHGEGAAQSALREAHQGLISKILRTPLRKLLDDVQESCMAKNVQGPEFIGSLQTRESGIVPPNAGVGSRRHLSSVLDALLALTRNRP